MQSGSNFNISEGERIRISPRAMALALENNIDIGLALPTGPMGRIIERDIERVIAEKTGLPPCLSDAASDERDGSRDSESSIGEEKSEKVCETITSQRLEADESAPSGSALTLTCIFNSAELNRLSIALASKGELLGLSQISIGEMIAFSFARILREDRGFGTDVEMKFSSGDMDNDRTSLLETTQGLSLEAFSRRIRASEIEGKSRFGVIDLSKLSVRAFSPPLGIGELMSLGIGSSCERELNEMSLTLRFDSRFVELYHAARLMKRLCTELENFELSLIK